MSELHYTYYESPIGLLKIGGTDQYIGELSFVDNPDQLTHGEPGISEVMHQCTEQLIEYFHGSRRKFDLPVHQTGTEFQLRVWGELMEIPYGKTKDNFGNIIDYKTEQDIINLIKLLNTTGSSIKVITDTIYSCGKTEGKERFELVEYEYKRGCNEFDVEGQLLPFPMSPTGIKETLDYYEIKHRNRKWTTADIKTYM